MGNGYSPFQINYDIRNKTTSHDGLYTYHNPPVTKCSQPPEVAGYSYGCSCADCEDSCRASDEAIFGALEKDFKVFGIDGWLAVSLILFGSLFLFFLAIHLAWLGDMILLNITTFFTWWGVFASKHPNIVISLSLLISLGLSIGIVNLEITTDPIELWASPNSRARIEN